MTRTSTGAHSAVAAIKAAAGTPPAAPDFERGTILDDMRLQPDTWRGDPFHPEGEQEAGAIGYDAAWHLKPDQEGEPALVGLTAQDTNDSGVAGTWPLEHTHPTRALAPGDRVLLVWARGVPVVMEIL